MFMLRIMFRLISNISRVLDLYFSLVVLTAGISAVYSPEKETEIRGETVKHTDYDMISRPSAVTTIRAGLSLLAIDELDLKAQKFSAVGWLSFEWEDDRLTWDPALKDDIAYIFSKPGDIWKPELVLDNSMDDVDVITNSNLKLRVKYNSTVEWEPPMLFTTHCQVDITYYPYDKQTCSIDLVSWGYTTDEVMLDSLSTPVYLDDFEKHGEWIILSSKAEQSNLTEVLDDGTIRQYPQILFWLHLERRTNFYNLNVVMPVFLTSLLMALTFIVPVDSGEKLSYILTVFLSLAVLLTLVADSMPPTSITTSVFGLYLGIVTVLAAFGILLTVCVLVLYHKEGSPNSSSCFMYVARFAAKVMCSSNALPMRKVNRVKPEDDDDEHAQKEAKVLVIYDVTWKDISTILDKFFFIVFSAVTIFVNISFIVTLTAGGDATDPKW